MQTLKILDEAAITHFPTPLLHKHSPLTKQERIHQIEGHFRKIMEVLDLDLSNDSLAETPLRVAKMYVEEIFQGLEIKNFPKITAAKDNFYKSEDNMILSRNITVCSMCEHHFVPMIGTASIAYISNGKVLGLSKLNRIVQYFCQRPQLQERLTAQIADCLRILLGTENVAVAVVASHLCVSMRGVRDTQSQTLTHMLLGKFRTNMALHREFLESTSSCR